VNIVARDFPSPFETVDHREKINYTSQWAGAHNRWVFPTNEMDRRDHKMALETFHHMKAICKRSPEAGITFMKGIEYLEDPPAAYSELTDESAKKLGIERFKLLSKDRLPDKVTWGCEYQTWCVNPMVYCSYLLRRLVVGGCRTFQREFRSPLEAFTMKDLGHVQAVVNCSGTGFGDPDVFITRGMDPLCRHAVRVSHTNMQTSGQTCVVANSCPATVTRQNADGSWTFCVPRNFHGGTIIGGTKEPDNWSSEPSMAVRDELLGKFAATYPEILSDGGEFKVLCNIVGRRPTRRGGMRLEREDFQGDRCVIHAYGLGGRGFEMSWGVARGVVRLLDRANTWRL
jgi:hypothetical protein